MQETRALPGRGQREQVFLPAGEAGQQAEMGHSWNQALENSVKSPCGITSRFTGSCPPKKQTCSRGHLCPVPITRPVPLEPPSLSHTHQRAV